MSARQQIKLVAVPSVGVGRVPPHSLEAEAAIIDAAIARPELAPQLVALVRPEFCYSPQHRDVWEAVCALTEAGTPLDVVTIADWLRTRGTWDNAGRATGLAGLLGASPAVGHWQAHAKLVRDRYRRRGVIATCQTIAAEGYGDIGDEVAWCNTAATRLQEAASALSEARDTSILAACCEAADDVAGRNSGPTSGGCPSGLTTLDREPGNTAGLHGGEVWIVTGKSGRGKTALACNTIGLATARAGRGVGIISAEMPRKQLAKRLACTVGRVDGRHVRARDITDAEYARLIDAFADVSRMPFRIDDRKAPTLEQVESVTMGWAEELSRAGTPLGVLVVDYLGKLDLETLRRGRDDKDSALLGRATTRLIKLAERVDCAVVLLSQLNDAGQIRDSRGPEHDAHWWLDIERDEKPKAPRWAGAAYEPEEATLVIRKARHGEPGVRCATWFHGPFTVFSDDDRRLE